MPIIPALYAIPVWLVFVRLKLIRWGWVSGALAALGVGSSLPPFWRSSIT
jgi:hypothetical protein